MRIPSFSIQNQRAIRLATCETPPPVMILTGPNGCGKSTLLNALRGLGDGDGRTLYVGPHRTSRRQQIRMRFLGQERIDMNSLLSATSLPGVEGISLPSNERDPWNFDEAQSFLKFSLCQIEIDRQAAIAYRFDEEGIVSREGMLDVWEPLRQMTRNLLPHLQFYRIDVSNREQIRCVWHVHSKNLQIDIDDLSSGEKAVVQLFFPLVEHHINERLALIRGAVSSEARAPLAVLMDEPELHLHPNLQGKVLDYIRALALEEEIQFILATHSPTIVEQATSEELYLLRPTELTSGENQLIRIATDDERLSAMRETFGSTSNITAMRRIVVVEGRAADLEGRRACDARIYGFLSNQFGQLTIVAGGGKTECATLAGNLNSALQALAPNLRAVALLDRDTDAIPASATDVMVLPVSMIENLLVDPDVIWDAITTIRHKTALNSRDAVGDALDQIVDGLEEHEIARRVKAAIPPKTFRLRDPIDHARQQVEEFTASLLGTLSTDRLATMKSDAKNSVDELKHQGKRREFFDGKRLLDEFFKQHLHATGMSKEIFIYGCAREASKRQSVSQFVVALFSSLGIEVVESTTSQPDRSPTKVPQASDVSP